MFPLHGSHDKPCFSRYWWSNCVIDNGGHLVLFPFLIFRHIIIYQSLCQSSTGLKDTPTLHPPLLLMHSAPFWSESDLKGFLWDTDSLSQITLLRIGDTLLLLTLTCSANKFLPIFHFVSFTRELVTLSICPLNTWRDNNVVITSKRRHFDVIIA